MVMWPVRCTQFQHPPLHNLTTGLHILLCYNSRTELNRSNRPETRVYLPYHPKTRWPKDSLRTGNNHLFLSIRFHWKYSKSLCQEGKVMDTSNFILLHRLRWGSSNPCTGLDRSWGFQGIKAPRFHDSRHKVVVRLSALRTGRPYPPGNIPSTHFC
jgi:hypothetical protein